MTIASHGRVRATEQGQRNATAVSLVSDGTALGVLDGVQSGLALTKTSGMGWQLGLGRAVIAPASAANGPVVAAVTAPETGQFAPGDATRDRIDIIALQIDETATAANNLPPVKTIVLQGAYPTSGSPARPAVPAGCLELWAVPVKAGVSAGSGGWDAGQITDLRPDLYVPGSEIGRYENASAVTIPGSGTAVVGQVTVWIPAGRRIRVMADFSHYGAAGEVPQFDMKRGGISGAPFRAFTQRTIVGGEGQGVSFNGTFTSTVTGNQEITLTAAKVVGVSGGTVSATAQNPIVLSVNDIGPA